MRRGVSEGGGGESRRNKRIRVEDWEMPRMRSGRGEIGGGGVECSKRAAGQQ